MCVLKYAEGWIHVYKDGQTWPSYNRYYLALLSTKENIKARNSIGHWGWELHWTLRYANCSPAPPGDSAVNIPQLRIQNKGPSLLCYSLDVGRLVDRIPAVAKDFLWVASKLPDPTHGLTYFLGKMHRQLFRRVKAAGVTNLAIRPICSRG